jgi:hypothetical protein
MPGAGPAIPQPQQVNIGPGVVDTPMGPMSVLQITINSQTIVAPLEAAAMQSFGCACIVAANEASRKQAELKASRELQGDTR